MNSIKDFLKKPLVRKVLASLGFAIVASILLTFLLEFRYFSGSLGDTFNFVFTYPKMFFFNAWLIFLLYLIIVAISGSLFRGVSISTAIILIIGYVHINKFASRGTPLLPEDFQLASEAASLASFVSVWSIVRLVLVIIAIFIVFFFLDRRFSKYFIHIEKKSEDSPSFIKRYLILPRLSIFLLAALIFMGSTGFIRHNNGERYQEIAWLDTTFTAWNQTRNYDENGFVVGFLYNWSKFTLSEPEGYSKERIEEIKTGVENNLSAEPSSEKNPEKTTGKSLKTADYNIVMILNESFVDPTIIEGEYPHAGGDIAPNLHRLMSNYPSGYLYSTDYGGGTANIEFEALTGLTNYWISTVPYTNLIPRAGDIPSIASFTKENGYSTTAIHAYNGGMYKRNIALKNEGFDTFITSDDFTHRASEGSSEYLNDRSSYQETLDVLNSGNGKKMIFTITMQNHTPYWDIFDRSDLHFTLNHAPTDDENRGYELATYFELLHNSDAYLGEFISELEKSDQKTVVLFFGDHAPGLFWELNTSSDPAKFNLSRTTPYFIYANFDLSADPSSETTPVNTQNLPTITPNCLTNSLYDVLGIARPIIAKVTEKVCKETPILAPTYFGDNDLKETKTLQDYKLLTYDILGGKKYFLK